MKNWKILICLSFLFVAIALFYSCDSDTVKDDVPDYFELAQSVMQDYSKQYTSNPETRSVDKCFDEAGCFFQGSMTDTILVPGFGSCMAIVTWDQYWCQSSAGGTNIANVHFDNFSAAPLGSGCDSLNQAWFNLYQNNQLSQLEQQIYNFNYAAREAIQTKVMEDFVNTFGVLVDCDSGGILLYSKFHVSTCFKTCVRFVFDKGIPKIIYVSSFCGDVCCEVTTGYCWNSLTNSIVTTDPVSSQDGICTGDIGHTCPSGYFPLSQHCRSTCR
jgi:hypothetical protein